jgi:arabinogalactan oligomer/maltooligosaccharide transport system substrate-binding protein
MRARRIETRYPDRHPAGGEPIVQHHRPRWPLLVGLSMLLAACTPTPPGPTLTSSPPTGSAAPSGSVEPSASPAVTGLEGELTIWHPYPETPGLERAALDEVLDGVATANPELVVNVVPKAPDDIIARYLADVASGSGPDLVLADNRSLAALVDARAVVEFDRGTRDRLADRSEVAIRGASVGDALWMVPGSLIAPGLIYDSAAVETPPTTTDALLTAVQGGRVRVGLLGGADGMELTSGWWPAFGGRMLDEQGRCIADRGGVADAFAYLARLKEAGATVYPTRDELAAALLGDQIDVVIDLPSQAAGYRESIPAITAATLPAGPSGPAVPLVGVEGWFLSPNSPSPDLATTFALAVTGPDAATVFATRAGHLPAVSTDPIGDPLVDTIAPTIVAEGLRPQGATAAAFRAAFSEAFERVLEGDDATDVIAEACEQMNEALS